MLRLIFRKYVLIVLWFRHKHHSRAVFFDTYATFCHNFSSESFINSWANFSLASLYVGSFFIKQVRIHKVVCWLVFARQSKALRKDQLTDGQTPSYSHGLRLKIYCMRLISSYKTLYYSNFSCGKQITLVVPLMRAQMGKFFRRAMLRSMGGSVVT